MLDPEKKAQWRLWFQVGALAGLALLIPPISYVMWPHFQAPLRRESIERVERDHEYFGCI